MNHPRANRRKLLATLAALSVAAGCAGLPRIDPTGNRILVWPKDQMRSSVPAIPAIAAAPANVQAPPVVTDPVFPPLPAAPVAPGSTIAAPTFNANPSIMPVSTAGQTPEDKLSITPARILAPVGSEVVLKASICNIEGFTLADQKIEWMLGRNGVGEFVETGGKGLLHPPLIPFFRGKKVDNYLAEGYTANGDLCLDRGTADPSDDVAINRGDAWVSVTAAHEGASYVTAIAPGVDSWNDRRASATIYWVDVQWVFPPASVAAGGRAQTLTTVVTRQSDGTPVEGYLVRYQVADGGVIAGGASGQVVEIRTGADGRATVEVSPTASGARSSQITTQLIRPAGFAGSDAPRLVIANGATTIQWSGDAQPYLPPSNPLPTSPAPITPIPSQTNPAPTTPTPSPSVPSIPARQPRLEVDVRGPGQATVGGEARFEVVIRNSGDGPATGIVLSDKFQAGLSHLADSRGVQEIKNEGIGTLQAGESRSIPITFSVNAVGQLCHTVTVTSAERGTPAVKQACVTAVAAPEVRQPGVRVDKQAPTFAIVGDPVTFRVTIRNTGETALTNVVVTDEYPDAYFQIQLVDPNVQIVSGTVKRVIDRMERGASKTYEVTCVPKQPTQQVAMLVTVTADSDPPSRAVTTSNEAVLEIRPRRDQTGAGGAVPAAGPPAQGVGLTVRGMFVAGRTARAGTNTRYQVTLHNATRVLDENVRLRIQFPPQLVPDLAGVLGPPGVTAQMAGGWLEFTPVATLRENEDAEYVIPVNVAQPGMVQVLSQAVSNNEKAGTVRRDTLEILDR